jgi:hypothetical protein
VYIVIGDGSEGGYEVRTDIRWPSTLNLLRMATCHGHRPFCAGCPPIILRKGQTPVWFAIPQSNRRGDFASPAPSWNPSLPFPLLQTPLSSSPSTSAKDIKWKSVTVQSKEFYRQNVLLSWVKSSHASVSVERLSI